MSRIAEIYDQLLRIESGSNYKHYPIHKKIRFDDESIRDLADWLIEQNLIEQGSRILDVGCGTGNTLFKLERHLKITGKGISISNKEIEFARKISIQNGIEGSITFEHQSFDDMISNGPFDVIIAIESLKHSDRLEQTIRNLVKYGHRQTLFIIADDYLYIQDKESQQQTRLWEAPSFISIDYFIDIIRLCKFRVISKYDMTRRVKLKFKIILEMMIPLIRIINHLCIGKAKLAIETYLGGLILERMYRRKKVGYYVFVIQSELVDPQT